MLLNLLEVPQHPKYVELPQEQTRHGDLLFPVSIFRMSDSDLTNLATFYARPSVPGSLSSLTPVSHSLHALWLQVAVLLRFLRLL
jgi:hypothetical protein